jgi:ATP-dependent protease HslVU (ClpYQ) ATPase subunit
LKNSEGSIIRQYEQSFAAYGIQVTFEESGLRRIAELAAEEQTGARGLMTVCEKVFRGFKYELPSTHIRRLAVNAEVVNTPQGELEKLLAEDREVEEDTGRKAAEEFAERFYQEHALRLSFTRPAVDRLAELAQGASRSIQEICAERFKDFQFGLKLLAQNTGQQIFVLDRDAVEAPDKVLSEWVVASYRGK